MNIMPMAPLHSVTQEGMWGKGTGWGWGWGSLLMCPYPDCDSVVHSAVKIPLVEPAWLEHASASGSSAALGRWVGCGILQWKPSLALQPALWSPDLRHRTSKGDSFSSLTHPQQSCSVSKQTWFMLPESPDTTGLSCSRKPDCQEASADRN